MKTVLDKALWRWTMSDWALRELLDCYDELRVGLYPLDPGSFVPWVCQTYWEAEKPIE